MSYFPDYRDAENVKALNDNDRAFLRGFSAAIERVKIDFQNAVESVYNDAEPKDIEEVRETYETFLNCTEIEMYVSVFEGAEYIPEDTSLIDKNNLFKKGTQK